MDAQYTIVIADDHPLFRNALFQSVHMAISGANLLEADSLDSLTALLEKEPDIDLLLLDLKMPGANGMSGLIHLRVQYPELPIVVISASEESSVIRQVHSHGAFGFIPKSSDMRELIGSLNQVLDGEPCFPRGIDFSDAGDEESLMDKIASLTPQQYKVLSMLSDGLLNKQIAYELDVSEATIKAHMTAIFRKLGVKNRTQAVILLQQTDPNA
ncbi:DNA-binding response regulator [Enterovibrio norvegicus]|uniref:Two component transcriptional regulator, LuxR family n=2 Tax=Enterovibrio norvegicus TaxID=188144 RepID=A0A1I5UK39_9GAMM|nr:response regulator transcription factor [Enterovibrio norvegicus]MCC4798849.1 response regulator transcription factor [Enterovibrio norvegicus]OEE46372.1 DNA-binding response regulator [Enterovibrio norvegicus]OEF60808.1 DNA-binding response regulator [Enterovibrio norvegicus]OEF63606.1 DNA-binding response regulator [Enterovibrio norvegicus]PMI28148.1 DNA-binding response regulator [Enterovibrio norvegicus]